MTGEVEVALTEEFETMTAEPEEGLPGLPELPVSPGSPGSPASETDEVLTVAGLIEQEIEEEDSPEKLSGAIRIQHAVRDRGHAREALRAALRAA